MWNRIERKTVYTGQSRKQESVKAIGLRSLLAEGRAFVADMACAHYTARSASRAHAVICLGGYVAVGHGLHSVDPTLLVIAWGPTARPG